MTLTTEQIEQVIDDCRKGAAMRGLFNKWIVEEMASELLRCRDRLAELSAVDNREEQPVAWRHDNGPFAGIAITRAKSVADSWIAKGWTVTPLYTAPPEPAVPEAISTRQAIIKMESHEPCDSINVAYKLGWNACRAAMLAQPVSQGYKLVPAEPTEDMIAAAMNCDDVSFNADETFCVNFGNIYAAMLAAAPDGGN